MRTPDIRLQLLGQLATKSSILHFMALAEEDYIQMKTEAGIEYLKSRFGLTDERAIRLAELTLFWPWWHNQWMRRDREFLNRYWKLRKDFSKEYFQKRYQETHDIDLLGIMPHKIVLENLKELA